MVDSATQVSSIFTDFLFMCSIGEQHHVLRDGAGVPERFFCTFSLPSVFQCACSTEGTSSFPLSCHARSADCYCLFRDACQPGGGCGRAGVGSSRVWTQTQLWADSGLCLGSGAFLSNPDLPLVAWDLMLGPGLYPIPPLGVETLAFSFTPVALYLHSCSTSHRAIALPPLFARKMGGWSHAFS